MNFVKSLENDGQEFHIMAGVTRVHGHLITNNDKALELAEQSIKNSGFEIGSDVALGIDFAGSSLWNRTISVMNIRDNNCHEIQRNKSNLSIH